MSENEIDKLAAEIKHMKQCATVDKDLLNKNVLLLKQLKLQRQQHILASGRNKFDRASLEALLSRRFFYSPSFSIYGGIAGLYDYGPPGSALQNNILAIWRQHFVLEEGMLEIECTNLTPESVLKTSGHVDRFADYMVRDTLTGDIFRADHLVKQVIKQRLDDHASLTLGVDKKKKGSLLTQTAKLELETILEQLDNYQGPELHKLMLHLEITAPDTGNPVTEPVLFNLMFETQIGPTGQFRGYLRPETAQGHFLNFKKLLEFNTNQMPFASASIGKSFRNEISPRQGLLRVREFTMAEIEHFVDPLNKKHARFNEIKDLSIPLYSASNQLSGNGVFQMTLEEAVGKGIINNQTLAYFIARIYLFLLRIGINPERLRFRQHMQNEMAHYACDCWDAEIESSYGWIECVGCADRSAYDLTAHSKATNEALIVREALPSPLTRDLLVLEVNKKVMGIAFKKQAAFVQGAIDLLKTNQDEWNEHQLSLFANELKEKGSFSIVGTDGNTYTLTREMVTVEHKSVTTHVRQYTPNVIEPSFGIGRILYSLLEHSYYVREGDEQRTVLALPVSVAPVKALILPISHNAEFIPFIQQCVSGLRQLNIANKVDDSAGSIGKRYSRNDELGTPFAITVDFQTLKDSTVTLRERDSTKQVRLEIREAIALVGHLVEEKENWESVMNRLPVFIGQEV